MSTQRYSEFRTYREGGRDSNGATNSPYEQRVSVPIEHSSSDFTNELNRKRAQDRLRQQDTSIQWVSDSSSGMEKFRVIVNIDGFHQNEVNTRVEGNKLLVYGEHIENKNQSTAKKIIEKSYELPRDIDTFSPQVTFPTATTMQIDFPSRHANVIYESGQNNPTAISNYNATRYSPSGFKQEKSSSEYTSTRRLGGGGDISGSTSLYTRNQSPRRYTAYDELQPGSYTNRSTTYSSSNQYRPTDYQTPSYRGYQEINNPPITTYRSTINEPISTSIPSSTFSTRGGDDRTQEQTYTETRRETRHQRSSPTTGVQSSHEFEHRRSGSPSISRALDEDRFRTAVTIGTGNIAPPPSSTHNVEVREYSRRIGGGSNNNLGETALFSPGFNSDAFYRSSFQPQIITDDRGQKLVEMKLDVHNYQPSEIKISINKNDLIVQAEHNDERPPTSSSRAYFYKQITLPPNTDLNSLSSQYFTDGRLQITAKLFSTPESIRYN